MINDLLKWVKVYKGPYEHRFAHKLLNDINVDIEKGIYGKRLKKARKINKYDIYLKVERN